MLNVDGGTAAAVKDAVAPTSNGQHPSPVQAWMMVLFLAFLTILSVLDRNIIALFLDEIRADLSITEVQASLIYGGAFAVTFAVMGLPAGWAVDRFSRRSVIFGGVGFWSACTIACGLVTSFPAMLAARAGVGAGEAALVPSAHSIISDAFPPERRTLPFAFYAIGQKAGAAVALLVGGALAAIFVPHMSYAILPGVALRGWQAILLAIGIPGLAIAFLIFAFREPPRHAAHRGGDGYLVYLGFMRRRWRFFTGHHIGFVIAQSVYTGVLAWSPAFFSRLFGWSPSQVGFWFGMAILLGPLASLPLHGWICDRLLARGVRDIHLRYQLIMLPLAAVPFAIGYLAPGPVVALVFIALGMTIMAAMAAAATASLQMTASGELRGKAASVWMLTGGLASFVGPTGVAFINQRIFGTPEAIGQSLAIFTVIALLLGAILFNFARRDFDPAA